MPLPVEPTFTAGVVATAAQLNQAVAVSDFLLRTRPVCRMRQSGITTPLPQSVFTPVVFDAIDVDTDGGLSHTANNDRYICRTSGWYTVHTSIAFSVCSASLSVKLAVNGAGLQGVNTSPSCNGFASSLPLSKNVHLNVDDYLQVTAWTTVTGVSTFVDQNSSSAIDIYFNLQG